MVDEAILQSVLLKTIDRFLENAALKWERRAGNKLTSCSINSARPSSKLSPSC
jgi:hypothetical protein